VANIYVRSTDGNNGDDGSTWALAKATIAGAAAIDAAGDIIWISQAHSESTAASVSPNLAGSVSNNTRVLCGNDASEPPTALSTSGVIAVTGAFSSISFASGYPFVYGLTLRAGTGSENGAQLAIGQSSVRVTLESCRLELRSTGTSGQINLTNCLVKNAVFRFDAASNVLNLNAKSHVYGGNFDAATTSPTALVGAGSTGFPIVEGLDLSNLSTSFNFCDGGTSTCVVHFKKCKLPSGWSGALFTSVTSASIRIGVYNCDDGDTNYNVLVGDIAGTLSAETTLIRTGGANDGATGISWKVVTTANPAFRSVVFTTDEIVLWNESTGVSKTVTVEILHDSATNLKDDEIWLEVQYLGTSGAPLGSFVDDVKADVLATAADQTTSSATWTTTGMSNPNKQKLSVTFTPQEKGVFSAVVKLAKASYTVYVDPKLTVS
jgi:hypothetical protein